MQRVIRRQLPPIRRRVEPSRPLRAQMVGLGALQPLAQKFVNEANAALDQANMAVSKADIEAALERLRPAYTNIDNSIKDKYIPYTTYWPLREAMRQKIDALIAWYNQILAREQASRPPQPEPPPPPPPQVVLTQPVEPPVPPPPPAPTFVGTPEEKEAVQRGVTVEVLRVMKSMAAARGVVDVQTSALKGIVDNGIRPELFPQGFQLFEMEPQMWKMIQYTEANYACTPENVMKVAFRADIYTAAQKGLADLLAAANQPPFTSPLPPVGTALRLEVAKLYADWFTCVYTWVSIAHFAVNVQPAFLNADVPETAVQGGQKAPTKTPGDGLPTEFQGLVNELVGTNNAALAEAGRRLCFGPQWAEWWTTGEATAWLAGNFAPWVDPRLDLFAKAQADGVDGFYPEGYVYGKTLPTEFDSAKIKARFTDPWFFWYVSIAHRPIDEIGSPWYSIDKHAARKADRKKFFVVGPGVMLRAAKAWANHILSRSLADQVTRSAGWYLTNYVPYWTNTLGGNIEVSIDEARASQKAAAEARVAAKQQTTSQIVNASFATATAVASTINPIAGGVAAGVSLLATGVLRLAFWRRKRRKKPKYDLMQPLVLRTLSDPDCSFFPRNVSLPDALNRVLIVVQAEIDNPAMVATLPKITALPPTSQPANELAPTTTTRTTETTVPATPSISPSASIQGGSSSSTGSTAGAAVRTSNSADLPAATSMPTPQQTQAAIAAAGRRAPDPNAVAPAPGGVPWALVAAGAAGVAVLVSLRRR